jgi:hypothetical protein
MSTSSIVNGTPHCKNIFFPNHFQVFTPSSSQHPYQYQPLIHVPIKQNSTTLGEMGASVDMLRAQVLDLSKRMETMESRFSNFEKIVSDDIFLLKNTLSEHSAELLNVRDVAENARGNANKMNESIAQQNCCVDEMADAISRTIHLYRKQIEIQKQASFKSTVKNAQLGMIRRRVSRIEEFMNEFYEQFESFKSINDIFSSLSDHINECDRDISMIVSKNYNEDVKKDNENDVQPIAPCVYTVADLNDYFSKYEDEDVDHVDDIDNHDIDADMNKNNFEMNDDDDFEKLF